MQLKTVRKSIQLSELEVDIEYLEMHADLWMSISHIPRSVWNYNSRELV